MEEKYSEIQAKYTNWQLKAAKETPQTENSGEQGLNPTEACTQCEALEQQLLGLQTSYDQIETKFNHVNKQLSTQRAATVISNRFLRNKLQEKGDEDEEDEPEQDVQDLTEKPAHKPEKSKPVWKSSAAAAPKEKSAMAAAAAAPKEKSKKLKIKPAVPTAKDLAVFGGSRQTGKLLPMAETESDMDSEFDFTEDESTDEDEYEPTPKGKKNGSQGRRTSGSQESIATESASSEPSELKIEDIKKMKVAELRAALSQRGANTKGLKAELVERLEKEMQNDIPELDFGIGGFGAVIHERASESKEDTEAAVADGEGIHRKVKLFSKEAQRGALMELSANNQMES